MNKLQLNEIQLHEENTEEQKTRKSIANRNNNEKNTEKIQQRPKGNNIIRLTLALKHTPSSRDPVLSVTYFMTICIIHSQCKLTVKCACS